MMLMILATNIPLWQPLWIMIRLMVSFQRGPINFLFHFALSLTYRGLALWKMGKIKMATDNSNIIHRQKEKRWNFSRHVIVDRYLTIFYTEFLMRHYFSSFYPLILCDLYFLLWKIIIFDYNESHKTIKRLGQGAVLYWHIHVICF